MSNNLDLLKYFVWSDIKTDYRTKFLGFLWAILDPFFMMLIYLLLVKVIFQRGGPQYPILLFSSLLAFRWLTSSLATSVKVLPGNVKLIQTVKFPYAVLPIARVLINLMNYLLGIIVLVPMLFLFDAEINLNLLWFPVLVLSQAIFVTGMSLVVAALGMFFRDLQNIMVFSLRIWLYLSPVLYSVTSIPERFRDIYMLINPMAPLLCSYRNVLIRGEAPTIYLVVFLAYGLISLIFGLYLFEKRQNRFSRAL